MDSAFLPVAHCKEVLVPDFRGLPNIHDEILSEVSTKDDKEGEGIDIEFCPTDVLLRKPVLFSS